jgi:hypothetical protein
MSKGGAPQRCPFFCFRFKVQGSKFKVQGSKFKVQGSRFKVQGSKFKVQSSRFKVPIIVMRGFVHLAT